MLRYALGFMTLLNCGALVIATVKQDLEGMVYALVGILGWGGLTWLAWPRQPFVDWLLANLKAVELKTARYEDSPITPDTIVVRYDVLISLIHFTWARKTEYVVLGSPRAQATRAACTMATLLFGWWSIPGLIEMPKVLERNRTHAHSVTVRQLMPRAPVPVAMVGDSIRNPGIARSDNRG